MKKFTAGLVAIGVVLCGIVTVHATDVTRDAYFGSDNSVYFNESDISDYTTVLIRKDDTTGVDGVVYVDQQSEGFTDIIDFMLKADTATGDCTATYYTATFGNSDGGVKKIKFIVGDITTSGTGMGSVTVDQYNKMKISDEYVVQEVEAGYVDVDAGDYKKNFVYTATSEQFDAFDKVYLVSADGSEFYGGFYLYDESDEENKKPTFSGDGTIALGIQIYNIPEGKEGMNLYLVEASE